MRSVIASLIVLSALGCGEEVQAVGPIESSLQTAPNGAPDAPDGATSPPTIRVQNGRLEVLGLIGTGTPCYDITAATLAADGTVRVEVTAAAQPVVCIQVLASFAYRVEASLPAGPQRIVVTHAYKLEDGSTREVIVVRDTTVASP